MNETVAAGPVTNRRILKIAVPVVLSNATVPILGAVDTGVVGQLGAAAPIGAVGIGAVTLSTVYWIFGFLRMGTAGLTAQALGGRNAAEVAALLTRALLIGGAAGLALILLQGAVFWAAFRIAPASDEVEALARVYMGIRIWSAPAAIAMYGIGGWLVAHERTVSLFWLQMWTNGVNIVLSILLVLGLGFGVGGVAAATVIAEWTGLAFGLWLTRGAFRVPAWRDWARVFDAERLWHMAAVNTDILIRSVILMAGFTSFLYIGADYGDRVLAANQILLQFLYITAYAMDGFAFAAEALVGQALGARAPDRVRRASLMSSAWGLATCVVLSAAFAIGGTALIDVMTTAEGVRAEARVYLPWMIAAPVIGCASWMLDGIFIGATRSRDMRNMMVISGLVYLCCLLLLLPPFGNHGLWASLVLFFAARGVTLGARYPALERAAAG
ncbi:MATE family efflux transporter [Rhodobacterales bacterium HKCCE2091]|nr:MATE family efflux transporter [Rhodobacterales bacterium HKCCE2091]